MGEPPQRQVSLSLPPGREHLPALLALAAELAGLAGLDQAGREGFLAALARAGDWALAMAAQGDGQPVQVSFMATSLGLDVRLMDQGPPLHRAEAG
ncbi:MAG: hypothetical protein ACOZHQ_08800 [Thermodesulfobacteriota bacterium]